MCVCVCVYICVKKVSLRHTEEKGQSNQGSYKWSFSHLKVAREFLSPYHKLLLVSSHAGASLCILVGSYQQLNQSGDGSVFTQSTVIGRAQRQVTDQTHGGLGGREEGHLRGLWVTDIYINTLSALVFIYIYDGYGQE